MTRSKFNSTRFCADTWVTYDGEMKYVISIDFEEALFGLVDEKKDVAPENWCWVRCESVTYPAIQRVGL